MPNSPEMQAQIDARAAAQRISGPSLPMPRLRHNGETGEWLVREVEGGKNAETVTPFKVTVSKDKDGKEIGSHFEGVVLRVAYMSQTKYKKDSAYQKMTREFTDFKTEPIELMKRVFGPAGKTETVKIFSNYQEFKAAGMLKDEDGQEAGSAYDLKVCLYVWHLERKEIIKLTCGGSARSEWFEYSRGKSSGDALVVSKPWIVSQPSAKLLDQIKTAFVSAPATTDKGMEYHRLSFSAVGMCSDTELKEVWEQQDIINAWVKGWADVNAKAKLAAPQVPHVNGNDPMPRSAAGSINEHAKGDEIDYDSIPF